MENKRSIIIDSFRYDETNNYKALVESSSGILKDVFTFLREWYSDEEIIVVRTSGSTGEPKTILLKKGMMLASASATCKHFGLTNRSTVHLCLPVSFIAGKMMLVRAMVSGAKLILEEPSSKPFKTLNKRINFAALTPMQVSGVLEAFPEKLELIDHLIIGGAPISPPLFLKLQKVKCRCYATYGMTETATHVAVKVLNGPVRSDLFCAIGNTGFTIDERSCLVITASHLNVKNLVTNDVVELADNQAFRWLGRIDNVINTGGIKVFPEKIEEKLASSISSPFFIAKIADQSLGEKVVLVIESDKFIPDFSDLTNFEVPKETYFLDQFLYTPTDKIQRELTLRKALDAQ